MTRHFLCIYGYFNVCFFGFVMNLDFGRYQLSLLTSAINSSERKSWG